MNRSDFLTDAEVEQLRAELPDEPAPIALAYFAAAVGGVIVGAAATAGVLLAAL